MLWLALFRGARRVLRWHVSSSIDSLSFVLQTEKKTCDMAPKADPKKKKEEVRSRTCLHGGARRTAAAAVAGGGVAGGAGARRSHVWLAFFSFSHARWSVVRRVWRAELRGGGELRVRD